MKKARYKDQNNENYKKIVIVLFVVIFILLLVSVGLSTLQKDIESGELDYNNLTTIKEVIEYYKSKYISERDSKTEGYFFDVFLEFRVKPYNEDDTSNEEYYMKLIEDAAKVMYYYSFQLIDEKNDVVVKVKCSGNRIEKILINDIEDYFIFMDSQISMKTYIELPITDFSINSPVLQSCVDNGWSGNINFGTRESIFENYFLYVDEGLEVRTIQNKIYNIIFTKKYADKVINNLGVGNSLKDVEDILGDATFKDEKLDVIGYKGEKFYAFFTPSEISIYRVYEGDANDFFKLADDLINEKTDLLTFMNDLTYMWPDYSEYNYSANSFFVAYPLKGIEISLKSSDISGILVYNSIKSTMSKIQPYLEDTNFVARLQIDSVYEAEKRRFSNELKQEELIKEFEESLSEEEKSIIGKSFGYKCYPVKDEYNSIYGIKFIGTSVDRPNREINDAITSYLWLTSDIFLYSKQGVGIFAYNLTDGKVQRVIDGNEAYVLKGYNDGILRYDNKEVPVQY